MPQNASASQLLQRAIDYASEKRPWIALMTRNGNLEQAVRLGYSELRQLSKEYGAIDVILGRRLSISYPFNGTELPVNVVIAADEGMKILGGYAHAEQDEEHVDYRHWRTGAESDAKRVMDSLRADGMDISPEIAAHIVCEKISYQRLSAVVPTGRKTGLRRRPEETEVHVSLQSRKLYDDKASVLMTHTNPYVSISVARQDLKFDNVRSAVDLMAALFHQ